MILSVLATICIVYIVVFSNHVPVAKAETEACSISEDHFLTLGGNGKRYVQVRITSTGHTGEQGAVRIAKILTDGIEHMVDISTQTACENDANKNSGELGGRYLNDICQEKDAQGRFQYIFSDVNADFTLRARNNCGAFKDEFVAIGSVPSQPTPTPLPAGVTQHVVQVCMKPYALEDPVDPSRCGISQEQNTKITNN